MKFSSDQGIVLRQYPQGEKHEVVVLLTKQSGKQAFMVYGSRDPKSRKSGVLEICNTVAFSARQGKSKMPVLQQTKLLRSRGFGVVASDESLQSFYRATSLLQETLRHLQDGQFVQNVYEDLELALDQILSDGVDLLYQVRLLAALGFLPEWNRCVLCAKKLKESDELCFSTENRGFAHRENCQGRADMSSTLSRGVDTAVVKLMNFWLTSSFADALKVDCSEEMLQEVRSLVELLDVHDHH